MILSSEFYLPWNKSQSIWDLCYRISRLCYENKSCDRKNHKQCWIISQTIWHVTFYFYVNFLNKQAINFSHTMYLKSRINKKCSPFHWNHIHFLINRNNFWRCSIVLVTWTENIFTRCIWFPIQFIKITKCTFFFNSVILSSVN